MKRGASQARGFTLIELLVVLTIISVIVALILPVLASGREAARRTQCFNNLFQFSVAIQNYANLYNVLPPGVVDQPRPIRNIPDGYHFAWTTQLLSYLEQSAVVASLEQSTSLYDPVNTGGRSIVINILQCPSDPGPVKRADGVAGNSYAACHNDVEAPIAVTNTGTFFLNSLIRYEDIPDGSSNTIFLGEKLRNPFDLGWASGTRATLRNTGTPINSGDILYSPTPIQTWGADGRVGSGPAIRPDPKNPGLVGGFASKHPGGADFAFGDGSVRFLNETISHEVYRCLGNRADGEMIGADSF